MAELLGYVSDIMLSADAVVKTFLQVKLINHDRLFAITLDSVRSEDHDNEEVLLWVSLDSLLEAGACGIDHFFV